MINKEQKLEKMETIKLTSRRLEIDGDLWHSIYIDDKYLIGKFDLAEAKIIFDRIKKTGSTDMIERTLYAYKF